MRNSTNNETLIDYSLAASAELSVETVAIMTRHEVAPGWNADNSEFEACVCLWDTGATYCGISDRFADKWKLENLGNTDTRIGNDEVLTKPSYAVTLRLADGTEHKIVALREHLTGVDFTIGLSLIKEGRFVLSPTTNHGSLFTFETLKTKHFNEHKYL